MEKTHIIFIFISVVLCACILSNKQTKEKLNLDIIQPTPTIDYYKEDLYAQCRGLEYFDGMIKDNESLNIYENFQKEYQKTVDNIERDKKELGLTDFVCPQDKIMKVGD